MQQQLASRLDPIEAATESPAPPKTRKEAPPPEEPKKHIPIDRLLSDLAPEKHWKLKVRAIDKLKKLAQDPDAIT